MTFLSLGGRAVVKDWDGDSYIFAASDTLSSGEKGNTADCRRRLSPSLPRTWGLGRGGGGDVEKGAVLQAPPGILGQG